MRALVVYESMFGNNRTIADTIAAGLSSSLDVQAVEVSAAPTVLPEQLDLLVVGGPNHMFGMSRPASREQAANETSEPLVTQGTGLREWLEALEPPAREVRFAVFDTRADRAAIRIVDRTAGMVARRLRRRGLRPLTSPESFLVSDMTGPLVEGELEHAEAWAARLAQAMADAIEAV